MQHMQYRHKAVREDAQSYNSHVYNSKVELKLQIHSKKILDPHFPLWGLALIEIAVFVLSYS